MKVAVYEPRNDTGYTGTAVAASLDAMTKFFADMGYQVGEDEHFREGENEYWCVYRSNLETDFFGVITMQDVIGA